MPVQRLLIPALWTTYDGSRDRRWSAWSYRRAPRPANVPGHPAAPAAQAPRAVGSGNAASASVGNGASRHRRTGPAADPPGTGAHTQPSCPPRPPTDLSAASAAGNGQASVAGSGGTHCVKIRASERCWHDHFGTDQQFAHLRVRVRPPVSRGRRQLFPELKGHMAARTSTGARRASRTRSSRKPGPTAGPTPGRTALRRPPWRRAGSVSHGCRAPASANGSIGSCRSRRSP